MSNFGFPTLSADDIFEMASGKPRILWFSISTHTSYSVINTYIRLRNALFWHFYCSLLFQYSSQCNTYNLCSSQYWKSSWILRLWVLKLFAINLAFHFPIHPNRHFQTACLMCSPKSYQIYQFLYAFWKSITWFNSCRRISSSMCMK